VVEPEMNADLVSSPFLFSFERIGATSTGKPALSGSVRFKLRQSMSNETAEASTNFTSNAHPVEFTPLSVFILIPFVDEVDGLVKQHSVTATIKKEDNIITAEVLLINDWVRLAYGVLAREGFQSIPAQAQIAFTFTGYVPINAKDLEFSYGGKS